MSLFTYNNVTLPYPMHTDFRQEAVYEKSKTDWYCTKFDITVDCLINTNYISTIDNTIRGGTDPAGIIDLIRTKLLKPRKALSITFGGTNIVPGLAGVAGPIDAQNGPQPQYCKISQLTNTSFLMTYRIIAHYWENNDANVLPLNNKPGSPVLYNRWEENVVIDNCNFSTRKRNGIFAIRSDNQPSNIADDLRVQMAVVGVPTGFLRESASYTVSPDGLTLSYVITDKEVYKKPPKPAFTARGHYKETVAKRGTMRFGECKVELQGDKTSSIANLLDVALDVALSKLLMRRHGLGAWVRWDLNRVTSYLDHAEITTDLYECKVSCIIRSFMQPSADGMVNNAIAAFYNINSTTPGSDDVVYTPFYLDLGTSHLLLRTAAYYDPSVVNNALNAVTGRMNNGKEPGTAGKGE